MPVSFNRTFVFRKRRKIMTFKKTIILVTLSMLAVALSYIFYRVFIIYTFSNKPENKEKPLIVIPKNKKINGLVLRDDLKANCSQQHYLKTPEGEVVWLIKPNAVLDDNGTYFENFYSKQVQVNGRYESETFCPVQSDNCICGPIIYTESVTISQ
jgi:hypothetical protein